MVTIYSTSYFITLCNNALLSKKVSSLLSNKINFNLN